MALDTDPRTNAALRRKIYLAGRVKAHDWRHDIVAPTPTHWRVLRDLDGSLPWSDLTIQGAGDTPLGWHEYNGPFFTGCDHGCGHRALLHGCGAPGGSCWSDGIVAIDEHVGGDEFGRVALSAAMRTHVSRECKLALDRVDSVFAWIQDTECFGTIWELGYAAARDKRVIVASPAGVDLHELWLSLEGLERIDAVDPVSAFAKARRLLEVERALALATESPIERLLLAAMRQWFSSIDADDVAFANGSLRLRPQEKTGAYRLDFAVTDAHFKWKIAVECDGHEFHERTKDQAQRDKSRDRYLAADGWSVLRFTGSEINRDPVACASQIVDTAASLSAKECA